MKLSEALSRIERQSAYYDRKSKESATETDKPKYKVAGCNIPALNIFPFYILTTTCDSYKKANRIEISRDEWEERNPKHLTADISYISPDHVESFSGQDIYSKISDRENGFPKVARLPDGKFRRLKILVENRKRLPHLTSSKEYLNKLALSIPIDEVVVNKIKSQLGIS